MGIQGNWRGVVAFGTLEGFPRIPVPEISEAFFGDAPTQTEGRLCEDACRSTNPNPKMK